jgi:putative membrane protein
MKKSIFRISMIALLAFAVSCGTDRQRETANEDSNEVAEEANEEKFDERDDRKDADFVSEQVAADYAELQMAKLATAKATNPEVKNVAQMIEAEHSKTLKELQSLATQKAISVPTEPEDQTVRKLENLSKENEAADFNKEWTKEMVDKHEKKIEAFEDQLERTEDAELKAWITQTLPNLRSHLDKLKACNDKLKDS